MQDKIKPIAIESVNLSFKTNFKTILNSLNFTVKRGEIFVVTGPSGSGKTVLVKIMNGELDATQGQLNISENLKVLYVPQQDRFVAATGLRTSYYSQRYENPNQEGIPLLKDYIQKSVKGLSVSHFYQFSNEMGIGHLLERRLLSLSNGERKKVQLALALFQKFDLLILDQPFIGLDVHARETLNRIIEAKQKEGITFVIVSNAEHIPTGANTVLELDGGRILKLVSGKEFKVKKDTKRENSFEQVSIKKTDSQNTYYRNVVRMKNVTVSLGGRKILSNINWELKKGEQWLLHGHNGAGKTTLLSLITADNPQAYNSDLVLFDRKRGSGESIWDIKRKIGFVSPELHHFFMRRITTYKPAPGTIVNYNSMSCRDVILSGFKDEIGFNTTVSELQTRMAETWLKTLELEHLTKSPFVYVSLGEQRIVLLVRALIKSPELLVLDEPCQGLDLSQTERFTKLLDFICNKQENTLIYVTHRLDEIPNCISLQIELENGQIKSMGSFSKTR